jgi:hypothetical protein
MAKRKCFIQHREFIPEVSKITGMSIIELEYLFDRAEILNEVCVFDVELTPEQAEAIDKAAQAKRKARHG